MTAAGPMPTMGAVTDLATGTSEGAATPSSPRLAPVQHVCVRRDHYLIGRDRPDGSGHLTFVDARWAYCAAARATEEHYWLRIAGRPLVDVRHAIDWLVTGPGLPLAERNGG